MDIAKLMADLKKLGPTAGGVVIGIAVATIPIAFKLDERYAKEKAFQEEMLRTQKQLLDTAQNIKQAQGQIDVLVKIALESKVNKNALVSEQPEVKVVSVMPPPMTAEQKAAIDRAVPDIAKYNALKIQTSN